MSNDLVFDSVVRYDRRALEEAEIFCQEKIAAERFGASAGNSSYKTDLVQQIEHARQKIQDAITTTEVSPPPVTPSPESSAPATPLTPSAPPDLIDESMSKSKRKRERKKRKAQAAAEAAGRAPTTPNAGAKPLTKTKSDVDTKPTPNQAHKHDSASLRTNKAARPSDIQPFGFVTNNNNQPPTGKSKNHVVDLNDPETVKGYINRVESLEQENKSLRNTVSSLQSSLKALEDRVKRLELGSGGKPASQPAAATQDDDDDDDIDLFASDDEDSKPSKPAPKPAAQAKKPAKAGPIAKSLIQLYVKPWDDETDMKEMERLVRSIDMDGLVWGTSQLVPVGYGIKKLQIACVVEDDKVGTDDLEDRIVQFEDLVQSVDIASFNKL